MQRPQNHSNGFVDPGGGAQTSSSSTSSQQRKKVKRDRAERDQNSYSYGAYEFWDDNGYEYDTETEGT